MNKSIKRVLKFIVIFVIVLCILTAGVAGYFFKFMFPYRATVKNPKPSLSLNEILTRDQAIQDLNYLYKHLEDYHPAYLDGSDNLTSAVKEQYQKELKSIPDHITELDLWRSTERIASKLHDGHTNVHYNNSDYDSYISDISQFKEYGNPIKINGVKTDSILDTLKTQFSYETESYIESLFYGTFILSERYLNYCGVDTSNGVTFTYQAEDGPKDYHYNFVSADKIIGYVPEDNSKWVFYKIDKKNNLAVFTLKDCTNNEEYRSVLDKFFGEVNNNHIGNIAVDLRSNGGGNSSVGNEFIKYLKVDTYHSWDDSVRFGWYLLKNKNIIHKNHKKDVVFDGNIYVLTNVRTYSAAMDFAMLIGDNGIGQIVGKASGNMPNSYGDVLNFQMPNSKLCFGVSFKKWYRVDKTKADQPLDPDYDVESDKALDKVYELIKKQ